MAGNTSNLRIRSGTGQIYVADSSSSNQPAPGTVSIPSLGDPNSCYKCLQTLKVDNTGSGKGIFAGRNNATNTLLFKSFVAGDNVSIQSTDTQLIFNAEFKASIAGHNLDVQTSNAGRIYAGMDPDPTKQWLDFRQITGGQGIIVSESDNTVSIGVDTANLITIQNAPTTSGVGVYASRTSNSFSFRNLTAIPRNSYYPIGLALSSNDNNVIELAWQARLIDLLDTPNIYGNIGDTLVVGRNPTSGNKQIQWSSAATGPSGAMGPPGPTGATGPAGAKGDKGDIGDTGLTGTKGDKGDTGSQGPQGHKGTSWWVGTQNPPPNNVSYTNSGVVYYAGVGDYYICSSTSSAATGQIYLCTAFNSSSKTQTWTLQQGNLTGPKGDQGDTGPQGPTGLQGPTGPAGISGSRWYIATGIPSGNVGVLNDFCLNSNNGDVYEKNNVGGSVQWQQVTNIKGVKGDSITGPKGDTGPQGSTGTRGSLWFSGTSSDPNTAGLANCLVNDYYLNTSTGEVWKYTGGATPWTDTNKSIKGPQGDKGDKGDSVTGPAGNNGTPGSVWWGINGVPDNTLGVEKDYALNQITGDVYYKQTLSGATSPTWNKVLNISGRNWFYGDKTLDDLNNTSDGQIGKVGDYYIYTGADTNTSNGMKGDIFQQISKWNWANTGVNIMGPKGATGAKGDTGTRGATWKVQSGAPQQENGLMSGDLSLDTDAGEIYQYDGVNWIDTGLNLKGPQGSRGLQGDMGDKGDQGTTWYNGSGAPTDNTIGNDNDYYLDFLTGDVYPKQTDGTWATTPSGNIAGNKWFNGSGVPSDSDGNNGDYYLNRDNGDFYRKISNAWGQAQGNIAGSKWLNGTNAPNNSDGWIGDYYLDRNSCDVYAKDSSGWNEIANIKGGLWWNGTDDPPTIKANYNDLYICTTNGNLYQNTDGNASWTKLMSILGPQGNVGPSGPTGTQGPVGTTWYNGNGAPSSSLGAAGDYYIDTYTGDLYQKSSDNSSWSQSTLNIKGPQGDSGKDGSTWIVRNGQPAQSDGNVGDYFLNLNNGNIFKKLAGTNGNPDAWSSSIGTLQGSGAQKAITPRRYHHRFVVDHSSGVQRTFSWTPPPSTEVPDGSELAVEVYVNGSHQYEAALSDGGSYSADLGGYSVTFWNDSSVIPPQGSIVMVSEWYATM